MRAAHDHRLPGEPAEVEGVHRLPVAMQHVVGHVDHVGDRAQSERGEAPHEPLRTGPHRHAANDDAHVAWAAIGVVELHLCPAGAGALEIVRDGTTGRGDAPVDPIAEADRPRLAVYCEYLVGVADAPPVERRDLARHAVVREQVGAIREHVDVVLHVADGDRLEERRPGGDIDVEGEHAVMILAEAEFARRAEHPARDLAANLPALDEDPPLVAGGHDGADAGKGIHRPLDHVRRAAHDIHQLPAPVIHLGDPEVVGVGVAPGGDHARHDDAREVGAQPLHPVDGGHVRGDERAQRVGGERVRDEGPQPFMRDQHLVGVRRTVRGSGRRNRRAGGCR